MFRISSKNPMYQQEKFIGQVRDVIAKKDIPNVVEPVKAKSIALFGESLEELNSDVIFVYEKGCGTRPSSNAITMISLKAALEAVGKDKVVVLTYKALKV